MKIAFAFLVLLVKSALAQDVVQVICHPTSMVARVQKQLVTTANHKMENVHLNDRSCVFDEEDGDFFIKTISPITSCGTHYKTNDTHVVFTNSISTVDTGPTYPYGIVIGSQANNKVLSALISCTYRIDLSVSTMFTPNITTIVIQMPDAFEIGEFQAAMALYENGNYRNAFPNAPLMNPEATLYVGVRLLGDVSPDIYLLMEECWGTISNDPLDKTKYPLITQGCGVAESGDGLIKVTENGISHQGLWSSPVFKFVGDGEEFDNVWLHCDLQLCINKPCKPTCPSGRRRRSIGDGTLWGPGDFNTPHVISVGPIGRVKITESYENDTKTTVIDVESPEKKPNQVTESPTFWTPTTTIVIGVLGGLALIAILLVLVAVIVRSSSNASGSGLSVNGVPNKAFA